MSVDQPQPHSCAAVGSVVIEASHLSSSAENLLLAAVPRRRQMVRLVRRRKELELFRLCLVHTPHQLTVVD